MPKPEKRNSRTSLKKEEGKAREVFAPANLAAMFDIYENREAAFSGF